MRQDSELHIYRNEISSYCKQLLYFHTAHKLYSEKGAWLNLEDHFNNVVELYTFQNAFLDTEVFIWKLASDNRKLWGHNQAWNFTPCSVVHSQSPIHTHDIMIAHMPEKNFRFSGCVAETNIEDFLSPFEDVVITYQNKPHYQKVIVGGDWLTHCCELGAVLPNTHNLWEMVCWKCGVNKHYLKSGYLEDPFHWNPELLTIADFPNAVYHFLPLELHRYCMMHGVSNLLSNCLKNLYNDLPKGSRKNISNKYTAIGHHNMH